MDKLEADQGPGQFLQEVVTPCGAPNREIFYKKFEIIILYSREDFVKSKEATISLFTRLALGVGTSTIIYHILGTVHLLIQIH